MFDVPEILYNWGGFRVQYFLNDNFHRMYLFLLDEKTNTYIKCILR